MSDLIPGATSAFFCGNLRLKLLSRLIDFILGALGVVAFIGGGALAYLMTIPPPRPGSILPAEQVLAFALGIAIMALGGTVVWLGFRR
jgi:hypothetical protein